MINKSNNQIIALGFLVGTALFSCGQKKQETIAHPVVNFKDISSENANIEEPYLFTSPQGETYLSWIEKSDSINIFKFSKLEGETFSSESTIAQGSDWFVNWADYPQMSAFADGTLIAAFLQKSGEGTFAYDVRISISKDGKHWSEPFVLHDDKTQTEHGFVSIIPWGENMLVSWLDGRNTGGGSHDHSHDHGHHGQMTVRAAVLDIEGKKIEEWELDDRVCDCCQTTSAMTEEGPLVIFRDRSETEIRDLGIAKFENGNWKETAPIYMDLWEIAACPVNGPRVSAIGNQVAVAWYTGAKDNPEVKVSFSDDNGKSFETPTKIDLGQTLGRVDIEMIGQDKAMVCWMEEGKILVRSVSSSGKLGNPIQVATSSDKRSSGFPQMTKNGNTLWFAWTDDSGSLKKVKVAKMSI
ncbi:exo-alpha-sialidase [Aquiflexum sp. LQ15W]|uniref:exo-alpha-sialidase n=1 Tax=Cognataquiflexum nitidum TaxID=2922272 RepID=UPI001F140F43|nr:exo-alpha-sialidase [Cognataquiflexum nitidum]MCH6200138.1 exo-alpha-sialidase [Cognataquiflexum nitidum]